MNELQSALQWLLDDMHDAGETHDEDGTIYDSVENAAKALVDAGGNLAWYPPIGRCYQLQPTLLATIPIRASSLQEARRILTEVIEKHDGNLGSLPNGDPIVVHLEIEGEIDCVGDGE